MKKISGIVLTLDAKQIHYDHYQAGNQAVVIIAHGFFNSKSSDLIQALIKNLYQWKVDVIAFDFRGHGKSDGLFYWTSREYHDLKAIIKFAREKYSRIGLIGFSLGAATSIIALTRSKSVHSCICISTPTEFNKIDYHFWDLDIENDIFYTLAGKGSKGKGVRPGPFWLKKDKPIKLVCRLNIPIFYIHGDADWVIKKNHSELLYKRTKSKKQLLIIKKGPHAEYLLRKNEKELMENIKQWFEETLL
ncbi:MAG: alpha/beta fold hydrolase [Candidatus Omnitrophota bacterium]